MVFRFRDLTIYPISAAKNLVIACDSSAGIGSKKYDSLPFSPEIMAAFCVRVPLLELICFGAKPKIVVDLIGNEYEDTGKRMIKGISRELEKAGFPAVKINGSTEENMQTFTTSIGVTVIGEKAANEPLPSITENTDLVRLGIPYVGKEVIAHLDQIFSYDLVKELRAQAAIVDLLPVGSKGIAYEAGLMATKNQLTIAYQETDYLQQSAGPATVILAAVNQNATARLLSSYPLLQKIGEFKRR